MNLRLTNDHNNVKSSLAGKSVVVTRALHQADELNTLLYNAGAVPLSYPCIDIAVAEDSAPLDNALREAVSGAYEWLILSSSNTAMMLSHRLHTLGLPRLQGIKVAAVGEATAQAARDYLGLQVDLMPYDQSSGSLSEILPEKLSLGTRVLLPQSEIAVSSLREQLIKLGVELTTVNAYRTVIGSGGVDMPALLNAGKVDAITFTSPSTIEYFLYRFTNEGGQLAQLSSVAIACIGATTANAAETNRLRVSLIPARQTMSALTEALERYFAVEKR